MNSSPRLWLLLALLITAVPQSIIVAEPLAVTLEGEKTPTVSLWLESSLKRVFPNTEPGSSKLELLAPRNGTISFQACVREVRPAPLNIDGQIEGADDLSGRVRLVGLVPMPH